MKNDKMNLVNLTINGNRISLTVPGHLEPIYRIAGNMLDERALQLKKEYELNNLNGETIALLLAIEGLVDGLQLQKENEGFRDQIDKFLDLLDKPAAWYLPVIFIENLFLLTIYSYPATKVACVLSPLTLSKTLY